MKIWESNFTKEQNNRIHHYYFRGGFDYSKLSKKHKVLMSLMKIKLKNQKNPTEDDLGMLDAFDHPVDFTDKKYIQPLIDQIKMNLSD